eukprot:scaffold47692_cov30-Tisochrysis_lutea.AAC.1
MRVLPHNPILHRASRERGSRRVLLIAACILKGVAKWLVSLVVIPVLGSNLDCRLKLDHGGRGRRSDAAPAVGRFIHRYGDRGKAAPILHSCRQCQGVGSAGPQDPWLQDKVSLTNARGARGRQVDRAIVNAPKILHLAVSIHIGASKQP